MTTHKEKNIIIKKVKGYSNYYAHSDGYIFTKDRVITQKNGRTRTIKGRIMKSRPNNMGYHVLDLYENEIKTTHLLHRILLKTLNPTNDDTLQVNHIDRNKSNNALENLEWTTASENAQHYADTVKHTKVKNNKKTNSSFKGVSISERRKEVVKIDKNTNEILGVYESLAEAARQVNCATRTISDAITNRRGAKTAKGFVWKYLNDLEGLIDPSDLEDLKKSVESTKSVLKPQNCREVVKIDKDTNKILDTYESIAEAARQVNCTPGTIRDAITNRRGIKTAKGFVWKYKD